MLSKPSPHPNTSVTCGNMEAWLICEEHWMPASGAIANSGDPVQIQVGVDGVVAEEWYHVQAVEISLMESVSNS